MENIFTNRKNLYVDIIKYVLISIPIFIYSMNVYKYAINIPRQDDYDAILKFLINFKKADFSDKLSLLFAQHNEHRIFASRVVYAVYYSVFGDINFRHLILLNVLTLILLFINICYFIRKCLPKDWYIAAFVFSLCLFDLNNFENAVFAMAGMQNYGIMLLFTSSLFFYSLKNKWYLIPAIVLQAVCVFSSGNGNLGSFLILLFVLFNKDKRKIIAAITTFIIAAPLYYYHYNKSETKFFTLNLSKVVPFFLHVTGGHFSYDYGIICGIALLAILLITMLFYKRYIGKNGSLELLTILVFVLSSMLIMSVFRGNLPVETAYSSRYLIYPNLLVSLAFFFILITIEGRKIKMPVVITAIVLLLCVYPSNYRYGKVGFESFRSILKTEDFYYPDKNFAKEIANESAKQNIYDIDKHRNDK